MQTCEKSVTIPTVANVGILCAYRCVLLSLCRTKKRENYICTSEIHMYMVRFMHNRKEAWISRTMQSGLWEVAISLLFLWKISGSAPGKKPETVRRKKQSSLMLKYTNSNNIYWTTWYTCKRRMNLQRKWENYMKTNISCMLFVVWFGLLICWILCF